MIIVDNIFRGKNSYKLLQLKQLSARAAQIGQVSEQLLAERNVLVE